MGSRMRIILERILKLLTLDVIQEMFTIMGGMSHMKKLRQETKRGNIKLKELSYSTKLLENLKKYFTTQREWIKPCTASLLVNTSNLCKSLSLSIKN